jgi:hypothetical protein
MRFLMSVLICILLSAPAAVLAEGFGVIDDPDGWVNVRKSPGTKAEVVAKIDSGELLWLYEEAANDWVKVVYQKGKEKLETTGFIHGSRIKRLDAMVEIPIASEEATRMTFGRGMIKVQVESGEFDVNAHRYTRGDEEGNGDWIRLIDGKTFWGTDGGVPSTTYRSITASVGETTMAVPAEVLKDVFEPNLGDELTYVMADPETDAIYLVAYNSDGAGGYVVAFRFEDGKYAGRIVLSPF